VTTLVVSVGGSAEPVIRAVSDLKPERIVWLVSEQTRATLESVRAALAVKPSWQKEICTPDAEDITATFDAVHQQLGPTLADWRVEPGDVTVDITGGTKPMTAALALAAVHLAARFQYIGGTQRTKGGVGIVETGSERTVQRFNPWEAFAIESLRTVGAAYRAHDFAAAREATRRARERVRRRDLEKYLDALDRMLAGFDAWDRFDYGEAHRRLKSCRDDLALRWSGDPTRRPMIDRVEGSLTRVEQIRESLRNEAPSGLLLEDLIANALRRREMGRYDDAVARLYRFLEGLAQAALWERFRLRTAHVPLKRLPADGSWDGARSRSADGSVKLGLRDAYRLLQALGDPLGAIAARLDEGGDLAGFLRARNQSLLAHGTEPVGAGACDGLLEECLKLAGVERHRLFQFPELDP
jgi:CRISPR-associated protein (TIGR02710 family)